MNDEYVSLIGNLAKVGIECPFSTNLESCRYTVLPEFTFVKKY